MTATTMRMILVRLEQQQQEEEDDFGAEKAQKKSSLSTTMGPFMVSISMFVSP